MSFDWEVLVVSFFIVVGILGVIFLGTTAAFNANEQDNKFQIECVNHGGELRYDLQAREKLCIKD